MFYRAEMFVQGGWSGNGLVYRTEEHAEQSARDLMSRWTLVLDWSTVEVSLEDVQSRGLTIVAEPTIKGAGHRVQL